MTVEEVVANMQANGLAATAILRQFCQDGLPDRSCYCQHALQGAIMTDSSIVTNEARERLAVLIGDNWPA